MAAAVVEVSAEVTTVAATAAKVSVEAMAVVAAGVAVAEVSSPDFIANATTLVSRVTYHGQYAVRYEPHADQESGES